MKYCLTNAFTEYIFSHFHIIYMLFFLIAEVRSLIILKVLGIIFGDERFHLGHMCIIILKQNRSTSH